MPNRHTIGRLLLAGGVPLGATALLLGGCTKQYSDADIRPITLAEVRQLVATDNGVLLVDPRSPADYQAAHLPGARNVALTDVTARASDRLNPELARHKSLVVYGDDPSSAIARVMTKRIMEAGHERVWLFSGGLAEWRRAGLETQPASKPSGGPTTEGGLR